MKIQRNAILRLRRAAPPRPRGRRLLGAGWAALCLLLAGCGVSMYDQPRYEPYERSDFFANGTSAQQLPQGVVARTAAQASSTGGAAASDADTPPVPVTRELIARGQNRYNIYCAPCHGLSGYGDGEIVRRGFSPPPSFHSEALRSLPNSRIFDVITNGYGQMYPYGYRVTPEDRWAIISYIRALQLSQNAALSDVPADQRDAILGAP